MSVSIRFSGAADGDDGPFQLASASGWQAFARWVDGLPSGFTELRKLTETGTVKNTAELSDELLSAEVTDFSPDKDIADTIEQLQEVLGVGDPDEVATVEM